ncbi:hypothetical protein A3D08_01515 [Candidatus Roizmanbacteria bacterium RIFCSPHIGHO2_02_FULL_43_11]|uniref:Nucleotidyl transferase AbiEii toxin, Type IV TA system n=1 Tax=Candidatus Roizmanbacteria bacterium RIFCSPHIGHO2_02_FULL_43_11 TaxID=1802043 RepID=A0A1F7HJG0_9BACT|nr:MAG: hypothetical protein A3D08_01515 [Candidatus Roizmanbacteria bacterium RIFCSPHIGHO2_02_FULL_43_11]
MLEPTNILTEKQLFFLKLFSTSPLTKSFYLSGGAALCGFYIPYRYSEDLDFLSENEFDIQSILVWLKSIKKQLEYDSFDIQTSFNRNLIFLEFGSETLKTEFTYYPFPSKASQKYLNVTIDSLEDIALNKLFTIYQNPRFRDFMDLFKIIQEKKFDFRQLRLDAKAKFDWDIEMIQLGSQLLKVTARKDIPVLVGIFDYGEIEAFFTNIASSLQSEVLK